VCVCVCVCLFGILITHRLICIAQGDAKNALVVSTSSQEVISIDDFDEDARVAVLNSPRSVEACNNLGLLPSELLKR